MSDLNKPTNSSMIDTAGNLLKEGNPITIIGGIALGVIAVGGMAIKAISDINKK